MQRGLSDLQAPSTEYIARRTQRRGLMKRAQFAFMLALWLDQPFGPVLALLLIVLGLVIA